MLSLLAETRQSQGVSTDQSSGAPHEIQEVERSSPRRRGGQGSQCRIGPDLGGKVEKFDIQTHETHAYLSHNFHSFLKLEPEA